MTIKTDQLAHTDQSITHGNNSTNSSSNKTPRVTPAAAVAASLDLGSLEGDDSSGAVAAADSSSAVSYENINMDFISQLCAEGFAQGKVIRALGITRNDLGMARDILKEFTNGSSGGSKMK